MIVCLGVTPAVQRTMTFARLELDSVNRAIHTATGASGKSCNVVRVGRTLGEQVVATGFVGGESGQVIRRELEREDVPHDFVEVDVPTRQCTTVIEEEGGTATELIEESAPVAAEAYDRLVAKLKALLPGADLLVMSGSLTPGAPDNFYARCCEVANANGVRCVLDAREAPLVQALRHKPLIVKPNAKELAGTYGLDADEPHALMEGIGRMVRDGAQWVLVTRGGDEALLGNSEQTWRMSVPRVKVVSAIGSGDSLAGGLAVALRRGKPVPEAVAYGIACGSANAMVSGAGTLYPADVERLVAQVEMTPI